MCFEVFGRRIKFSRKFCSFPKIPLVVQHPVVVSGGSTAIDGGPAAVNGGPGSSPATVSGGPVVEGGGRR